MRIGILGSGLMCGKLGTIFARAGHEVIFSYARSEQKLKRLTRDTRGKARAGTPLEVAQEADAVLLAVHWSRLDDVLKQTGDLSGKAIVTCSLPMNDDSTELVVAHTSSGAEDLAKMIPKARVVAAFQTVPSEVLFGVYQARRKASRPSLVYCGDDESGKGVAARLIRDVGFDPVDAGPLWIARYTELFALLVAQLAYEREGARSPHTGSSGSGSRHDAGPGGSLPVNGPASARKPRHFIQPETDADVRNWPRLCIKG
jgi:predicted dinucleotide-binding enzyme